MEKFLADECLQRHAAIEKSDLTLFTITDDHKEILDIITSEPIRS
jgi:hypothetical protein